MKTMGSPSGTELYSTIILKLEQKRQLKLGYDQNAYGTISDCHRPVMGLRWQSSWSPVWRISRRTIKKESIMIDCRLVNHHACCAMQNLFIITFSDKLSDTFSKTISKVVGPDQFTKSVDHIPVELRMSDPLSQKGLQIGVVLLNKVTITLIKLRKENAKLMQTCDSSSLGRISSPGA